MWAACARPLCRLHRLGFDQRRHGIRRSASASIARETAPAGTDDSDFVYQIGARRLMSPAMCSCEPECLGARRSRQLHPDAAGGFDRNSV